MSAKCQEQSFVFGAANGNLEPKVTTLQSSHIGCKVLVREDYNAMKLVHVSITARSADRLSAFYIDVFDCEEMRPPRTLSGEVVSRGNGLPNSMIYSIWLRFPDQETPFLELLEYESSVDRVEPRVNEIGISHLSFQLDDIQSTMSKILKAGGSALGETTNFGTTDEPFLIVYMRDCEGNILELE